MLISEKISEKKIGYWDFTEKKTNNIHSICRYPATMVPDMQKELISIIMEQDHEIGNILDPFHGSGVTLVEGANMNLTPVGIDINPLANLITRVKLQGINKLEITNSIKKIQTKLEDDNYEFEIHTFNNIEKWYRSDFIFTFSKIKSVISEEKCANIRRYFWVCLINILKKYSNTRTSTFKLHVKTLEDIESMKNNIIQDFLNSIKKNYEYLPNYSRNRKVSLRIGDSIDELRNINDNSVDIVCTSPPYGDNSTTVTYGQYSSLPLFWIDSKDLGSFDQKLLLNYSSIDSQSLGGSKRKMSSEFNSTELELYLSKITENKRRKVKSFVNDYLSVMKELTRVTRVGGYIMLTIGNRRVDNVIMPLTSITKEFFLENNMYLEAELTRNIPFKRMPKRVSRVNDKSVESMNTEYVLIFRKLNSN